ncbi:uncharacterized protein LOC111786104 [Cucurbita pepo subsp. pepo]|uniref:uncharacterized protein LOC111786104 n=1 Tax=Cucurbita pepo subsp. pepo TaxID=3664 RepID=UPI000C9D5C42|nr:uncharacterized protein LOC111786104 [Cucurbita pepo subsp. pepo]
MDPKEVKSDLVLILDFGSQYTHLITRRIRSLSVFSLCISGTSPLKAITDLNPQVVILSGGPHSVHASDSPSFAAGFVEWAEANGVFVLGICYGLQLIVQRLGGVVKVGEKQEYGRMEIVVEKAKGLFGTKKVGDRQAVWMSHGDEVAKLPEGFEVVARSQQGSVAAVENHSKKFFGLQYHPEVMGFIFFFFLLCTLYSVLMSYWNFTFFLCVLFCNNIPFSDLRLTTCLFNFWRVPPRCCLSFSNFGFCMCDALLKN